MSSAAVSGQETGSIMLNLFNGARVPLEGVEVLVRIINGNQQQLKVHEGTASHFFIRVPFHNNFSDNYTIIAWARNHVQAGFSPIRVNPKVVRPLDLMLLPEDGVIRALRWPDLILKHPGIARLLATGAADDDSAADRYDDLRETRADSLAAFFNLTTALAAIQLPVATPLDYFKELIWDSLQPDRFFAWADEALVQQVQIAAEQGLFAPEIGSGFFHPGATSSYKQLQFGEANVQITFHENDKRSIDGVNCIQVEPDMDYYRDRAAHTLLEVIPNSITGRVTDPRIAYVLRWIAGRHAGVPEFNPPYTIEAA